MVPPRFVAVSSTATSFRLVNGSADQLQRWISVQMTTASHHLPRERHGGFLKVTLNVLFSINVDASLLMWRLYAQKNGVSSKSRRPPLEKSFQRRALTYAVRITKYASLLAA